MARKGSYGEILGLARGTADVESFHAVRGRAVLPRFFTTYRKEDMLLGGN